MRIYTSTFLRVTSIQSFPGCSGSLFFRMRRFPRRLLLVLAVLLLFTACGSIRPPEPPSLDLPKPPSDLRGTRKGSKVLLTWTVPTVTTDRQTAHSFGPTRICRGLQAELTKCGTPVGQEPPLPTAGKSSSQKLTGSYTDELSPGQTDNATGFAIYAIEVLNADGRGAGLSNQVHASLAPTLLPPRDFSARVTAQGVVLTWTSDTPMANSQSVHYVYCVYRRLEKSQQQILAGEVSIDSKHDFSLTDSSFEWEKTYEYHAEAVTVIAEPNKPEIRVEGDDTPEVEVFVDDVFPPAVPTGLQAVFSGPGQQPFIDLIWAPDTDADLDGYNVYRHEEGARAVKLNAGLVKTPSYRDTTVTSGNHYFYSVSAVDLRGNESGYSDEASESVP
jgi:hypothetical protein